jgi:hypothetical protein
MTVLFAVTLQEVPSTQERFVRGLSVLAGEFAQNHLTQQSCS